MEARKSVEANDKTTRDDDVRPRDFSNEVASRGRGEREREDIAVSDRGGYINALTKTLATIFFSPLPLPTPPCPLVPFVGLARPLVIGSKSQPRSRLDIDTSLPHR